MGTVPSGIVTIYYELCSDLMNVPLRKFQAQVEVPQRAEKWRFTEGFRLWFVGEDNRSTEEFQIVVDLAPTGRTEAGAAPILIVPF